MWMGRGGKGGRASKEDTYRMGGSRVGGLGEVKTYLIKIGTDKKGKCIQIVDNEVFQVLFGVLI